MQAMQTNQQSSPLSQRWTKQLLESCTPKELMVVIAEYGAKVVAARMGYTEIYKFLQGKGQ
jgi:hypothetical protein